ncbi:MAG: hypothetical protein QGI45_11570 [Myxococcota bacterium]|jgi:hypothetical protein|nr:hypothetical protein [Myxococcota bacterium]
MQTLETTFMTYHASAGGLHLRTSDGIIAIDKKKDELVDLAKTFRRGQKIRVAGEHAVSKALSTWVFEAEEICVA